MIAYFIARMKQGERIGIGKFLFCNVADHHAQIAGVGGKWDNVVVGTGYAVVKVRATAAVLDYLASQSGIIRVPLSRLDDSLGTLTANQLQAIRNAVEAMGYTAEEINAAYPDWRQITLLQLFRFVFTRRRAARWDDVGQAFIYDGKLMTCSKTIEQLDAAVAE